MKKLTAFAAVLTVIAALFALTACGKQVTVTFDGNGGATVDGEETVTMEIVTGHDFAAPVFQRDGYRFVGWDKDLSEISEDCSVKALWIKGATVKFDMQGGEMEEQEMFFDIGAPIGNLPVPEKGDVAVWNNTREYRFTGWYLDGREIKTGYVWNSDKSEITLVAHWEKAVKITFDSDGGDDFGYSYIYRKEEIGRLPSPEKGEVSAWNGVREYKFLGWYHGEQQILSSNIYIGDDDSITLTARWENGVKVNFESGNVSIEDFAHTYFFNGKIEYLPKPRSTQSGGLDDNEFLGWYLNGVKVEVGDTFVADGEEITLVAKWSSNWTENY